MGDTEKLRKGASVGQWPKVMSTGFSITNEFDYRRVIIEYKIYHQTYFI